MIVRLPVSVAFGTDEEFDLRVRLEKELGTALAESGNGECTGGEIDTSFLKLYLDAFGDPLLALEIAKGVLERAEVLDQSVVILETRLQRDPDDYDWRVLWPPNYAGTFHVA
jgi:hypothetical protein